MEGQSPTQIIIPPRPRPTADLERDADIAIRFLETIASSNRLDPDLRITMNDIKNTIKSLKADVVRRSEEAQASHDRLVEVVRSQRLTG